MTDYLATYHQIPTNLFSGYGLVNREVFWTYSAINDEEAGDLAKGEIEKLSELDEQTKKARFSTKLVKLIEKESGRKVDLGRLQ